MAALLRGRFIYIDESGHTGDLITSNKEFNFNGQPHFTLAAVGPILPELAEELLGDVVRKHRLHQQSEIKSDALGKRPGVARDLAMALRERGIPVFVEAVDKVYYLIISIINYHILPVTAKTRLDETDRFLRNHLADYLYQAMPDSVLGAFIDACKRDTSEAVRVSLEALLCWAQEPRGDSNECRTLDLIARSVSETINDLEMAMTRSPAGHRQFLPLPDADKRSSLYWVLPNYSSLTSLYARINRNLRGRLSGVTLVHDDQAQYDEVLRLAKAAIETIKDPSEYIRLGADYSFAERADLSFARSCESPGLMIADVLAGHVRRVLRDHMDERNIHDMAMDAFIEIWDGEDVDHGTGIQFVLPTAAVQRLQLRALAYRRSRGQLD
ncbi:TPA: DUF3800 domain-containing protein [Stenotrophomonas maltophilia]|nr:DUF3800 domain-containing protein [Stenotrophomonas maltophilia]